MTALISGSFAFDTIMAFHDRFANHILPDQIHNLNVSFLVQDMRREFGGCAGNIAYNLQLLGDEAVPLATVGRDFEGYARWLARWEIAQEYIQRIDSLYSAQAYITTDSDDNQITAFHPGAMMQAHEVDVPTHYADAVGIVAPNGREAMLKHARQFPETGIPFIFDPGQGLPMFDGDELTRFIDQATWVVVNDYESQLLQERTGLMQEAIAARVQALVVTRGAEGSLVYTDGECLQIPAATPDSVNDPTGCGDAYRAGFLYGLARGLDWASTGRVASLLGAIKVARHGTQNHHFTMEWFRDRYRQTFGMDFPTG